ncbi:MAG: zinc metalloprotease HtpX [Legionellales bacterium]|nr:zinc metalloprotease HtpX [Legionellales bacterium]|tara:strand:- start:1681 stop:2733 length:1053 start_codon:yes stop_codon:yes gene_type:complete
MNNKKQYKAGVADWRQQLRKNSRRTQVVIISFVALYVLLGLLIDIYLQTSTTRFDAGNNAFHLTITQAFIGLVTLKLPPIATMITLAIAVISLLVTFTLHDKIIFMGTDYQEIKPNSGNLQEQQLYNVVEEMKVAAGLRYMPRVFIINAPYMNAFASGYSEKSALVAITRGLLEKLERSELQAVMAHELSHIRHLDIKLTLTASVLANLMLIIIDMLFWSMLFGGNRDRREGNKLFIIIYIIRIVLPIITMLLMMYLSRTREYMADAGAVELMRDNEPLAKALLKIEADYKTNHDAYQKAFNQTAHEGVRQQAYLYDPTKAGLRSSSMTSLFSTHPAIKDRLKAIGIKLK